MDRVMNRVLNRRKERPILQLFLTLILIFACCFPVAAKIYTWRDTKGVVHYSDTPPIRPELNAKEISEELPLIHVMEKPQRMFTRKPLSKKSRKTKKGSSSRKQAARAEKLCKTYEAKIKRINKQLRAGYKEPKGNQLRAKRRELSDKLFQECR